jgi:hypothetical protein
MPALPSMVGAYKNFTCLLDNQYLIPCYLRGKYMRVEKITISGGDFCLGILHGEGRGKMFVS